MPPLPKKESTADLEARQLLEPSSAEYRTVSTYFLDRLNPSEKVGQRAEPACVAPARAKGQRARRASGRRARARVSSARHSLSLRVRSLCCARPVRSHHVFYCAYSVRSYQVRARIAMIEKLNVPDIQAQYELILKQMVRREKKRMKAERLALDVDKIEYKWGFHACAAEVRLTTVTPLSHSHHSPITTAHHPCHHPPQPPQPHHHSPPSMLPPPRQIPCTDPPPASSCVTALHPHVPYRSPPPPTSRDAA